MSENLHTAALSGSNGSMLALPTALAELAEIEESRLDTLSPLTSSLMIKTILNLWPVIIVSSSSPRCRATGPDEGEICGDASKCDIALTSTAWSMRDMALRGGTSRE